MKKFGIALLVWAATFSLPGQAFENNAERIDYYLQILNGRDTAQQQQMLSRLQWSGLSDPALYDVIEQRLLAHYGDMNRKVSGLMAHHARALGYSGNEKYRKTLELVSQDAENSKLRSHAAKALMDLNRFSGWWELLAEPPVQAEGQSIEAATYLQMLNTDNVFVQRLAARAVFHERIQDPLLLERMAALVEAQYLSPAMEGEAEDTLAWFCKALGENAQARYQPLLQKVAAQGASAKVAKYARKYSR